MQLWVLHLRGLAVQAEATSPQNPFLRRNAIVELSILGVRRDQDPTLVVADGLKQRAQAFSIEVARGVVQNENVWMLPHRHRERDHGLFAFAHLRYAHSVRKLWVHPEVRKVVFDARCACQHVLERSDIGAVPARTTAKAMRNILDRSLPHVLFEVLKVALRHASHAQTSDLPDRALGEILLPDQHLDERGLSRTLRAGHHRATDL
mmetsp:Transcript_87108/g.244364  ORF Transcript_87108/g.244364 Transcript_87108/m.244364 type:complete len:206 (+) Transcript_87108:436-1053(+)